MDNLLHDFRYAIRSLIRTPAFTIAAVATLALGIGANTAIFSIVDSVLLRPAPIAGLDRVMMMWETDRSSGTTREPSSIPDFVDFVQRQKSFRSIAAFAPTTVNLTRDDGDPDRLDVLAVTEDFMSVLDISPVAGRLLDSAEIRAGGPRGAIISERLATRLFQSNTAAIGKSIRLNDAEWNVVGVLPQSADFGMRQILGSAAYARGFADRSDRSHVDVWLGARANYQTASRDNHPIFVIGRLAEGATRAQAQTEFDKITADLERQYPSNTARGANVEPLSTVVFGNVRPAMLTLLAAVGLVLLVACANVTNLLLVRAAARTREVSVRVALGAGMKRLAQQFIVEGIVLTAAGAGLGVMLAEAGFDLLTSMAPASVPRVDSIAIDGRVLLVTLVVSMGVALVFGLLPTLQARRRQLAAAMLGGGGRSGSQTREQRRFHGALIISEVAMATMLMIGAGLLIKSLWRLQDVDAGFASAGILKGEYVLPASRYPRDFSKFPNWPEQAQFNATLVDRVKALPGVEQVTLASSHPLDAGFTSGITVVGREHTPANWPEPAIRLVAPGYFETMHVAVRAGRGFSTGDDAAGPTAIVVNEAAKARYFDGKDPLGQRINLWGAQRLVVGVVANERIRGLAKEAPPGVYLPLTQVPSQGAHTVLVRTRGEPAALASALRAAIRDIDPKLPAFGIEPLPETIEHSIGQQRFTMYVLGAFAVVALLLAAVGVHGVLSYAVAQRTNEIGIRMALGADARKVRREVMSNGALIMTIGLVIGLTGALALSQLLAALLYGVGARDPMTFAAVAGALGVVAIIATYLPARRAARVDPIEALRSE